MRKRTGLGVLIAALVFSVPALALEVTKTLESSADPTKAWEAVGDFCAIADWHPAVEACEAGESGGKTQRTLTLAGGGGTIVEELVKRDDEAMSYTYKIVSGPLPVENYESTISVKSNGEGSELGWTGNFDAKGATNAEAENVIGGIYDAGLKGIAKQAEE